MKDELITIINDGYRVFKSAELVGVTDISVPVVGIDQNAVTVLTCPYIERVQNEDLTKSQIDILDVKDKMIELAEKISISNGR